MMTHKWGGEGTAVDDNGQATSVMRTDNGRTTCQNDGAQEVATLREDRPQVVVGGRSMARRKR
jgi:hypothetical protein